MQNIVQLFKNQTHEEATDQIITNLKEMHHCKPVNFFCAINGIKDVALAHTALDDLIAKRVVKVQKFYQYDTFARTIALPLYKYDVLTAL